MTLAEALAFVASGSATHTWYVAVIAFDFLAVSAFGPIVIYVPMGRRVFRAGGVERADRGHPDSSCSFDRATPRGYQSHSGPVN